MTEKHSEDNTARLIRAAYGPSARPTAVASEKTYRLLLEQTRGPVAIESFPDSMVGLLGGMLAIATVWLIVRLVVGGASFLSDPALWFVGVWAIANLSIAPVAGVVVLIGRKHG